MAVSVSIVRRILELTGVDHLIDVYPGLDAALAGLPILDGSDGDRRQSADRREAAAG